MDYDIIKKLQNIELALNEASIVAITNKQGVIQFANDKFCEISQYNKEELIGSPQSIVNSGFHTRGFFKEMWRTIGTGNVWRGEIRNRKKDGTYYWVDTTIVPFLNEKGKPDEYISIRHEITKLKEYEETIKQLAFYDPLTSLPNRNALNEWLTNQQHEIDELAVLFLDVDRFKLINDTLSHHAGDMLLKEGAKRLKSCLRPTDFIVRQGGDEFIIILTGKVEKEDVMKVVKDILDGTSFPFLINGKQIFSTVSIGISMKSFKKEDDDFLQLIDLLIKQADTAMYYAKSKGGNTYCFNTDEQNVKMQRYYQVELELRQAVEEKQFSIAYQPLVHLENNQMVGVEALLRWDNPRLGAVSPAEFIPLLEERGDIIPVGKWVLEHVCRQTKAWHDMGVEIERVSVNVSPIQFSDDNFVNDMRKILKETELDPKYLDIEITESTILPMGKVRETLHQLRDLGVHISIDDFGTGYSSLSYLKNLPINTIKIDKSFIHDLDFDEEVLVNTIITMGKNLKFKVLAEGIETEAQLAYLKENYCDEGQGYLWSKPVTADDITTFYHEQKDGL